MRIAQGNRNIDYGPGVSIELSGDEVATAILAYIVAHSVHIEGARTITVNGQLCKSGNVYVDPSGFVIAHGQELSGRANPDA